MSPPTASSIIALLEVVVQTDSVRMVQLAPNFAFTRDKFEAEIVRNIVHVGDFDRTVTSCGAVKR